MNSDSSSARERMAKGSSIPVSARLLNPHVANPDEDIRVDRGVGGRIR